MRRGPFILVPALMLLGASAWAQGPSSPGMSSHFAAPPTDPAGIAARVLAARLAWVPNRRLGHPHERWRVARSQQWSIRPSGECLAELADLRVAATPQSWTPTPVPTPVRIASTIGGVAFRKTRPVPLIVACELAVRLPDLAAELRRHGVTRVDVMSAYRREPATSLHAFALALDIEALYVVRSDSRGSSHDDADPIDAAAGVPGDADSAPTDAPAARTGPSTTNAALGPSDPSVLHIAETFEKQPDQPTCATVPLHTEGARRLRHIVCGIADTGIFSTVLSPNYNEGHWDHIHLDIRPDDPRFYLR